MGVLVVPAWLRMLLIADDRWSVSPGIKFAFQLIVALVAGGGVRFRISTSACQRAMAGEGLVELGLARGPVGLFGPGNG